MKIIQFAAEAATESSSITDWLAVIFAAVALVASGVALWYNCRTAETADKALVVAREAATIADRVARAEIERDHEMYKPLQIGPESFVIERNPRTGEENLFCVFTPARSYRILGDSIDGNSRSALSIPLFNPAGVPVKVFLDVLKPHRDKSSKKELQLRFWPPSEVDGRDLWTCPCGRPLESHEAPHWEMTVPVETPQPPTAHAYSA